MIQRHAGTLNWLRKLTPEQINNAAPDIARAMEVLIDLNILKDILTTNKHLSASAINSWSNAVGWLSTVRATT